MQNNGESNWQHYFGTAERATKTAFDLIGDGGSEMFHEFMEWGISCDENKAILDAGLETALVHWLRLPYEPAR